EHSHWHFGLELRPLARRAVPARHQALGTARLLRAAIPHRGTQQQLLPLAEPGGLQKLAATAAARVPAQRESAAGPHPRQETLRPGKVDGPPPGELAPTGRQTGRAAGATLPAFCLRLRPPGVFPRPGTALDAGGRRNAAPELAPRRHFFAARKAPGRLLHHERRPIALHPAGDGSLRVRTPARPRPPVPLRRLLLRQRPALVGRPHPRMAVRGQRSLRLFQQRRWRQRRPQRLHAQSHFRAL
ncbi:MAG: FIG003003: hypothetical protein, partial [uncultured Cytophagales bacterium]